MSCLIGASTATWKYPTPLANMRSRALPECDTVPPRADEPRKGHWQHHQGDVRRGGQPSDGRCRLPSWLCGGLLQPKAPPPDPVSFMPKQQVGLRPARISHHCSLRSSFLHSTFVTCACVFFWAASLRNTDGSSHCSAAVVISHVDEPQRAKDSMESALRVGILTFSPISAFSPSFFSSLLNCLVCYGVQAHIMPLLLARRQVRRSRRRRKTTLDPRLGRQDGNSAV
jgi:hypothetical protein